MGWEYGSAPICPSAIRNILDAKLYLKLSVNNALNNALIDLSRCLSSQV